MVATTNNFVTLDSGKRQEYGSGMRRDLQDGKPDFNLMLIPGMPYAEQYLTRIAALYERGANKYGRRNWQLANSEEELDRFKSSAFRHFMQALTGETDEDHWAAVFFNINAIIMLEYKLKKQYEYDCAHCGLCDKPFDACECKGEYGTFVERDNEDKVGISNRYVNDSTIPELSLTLENYWREETPEGVDEGFYEQLIAVVDHPDEAMIPEQTSCTAAACCIHKYELFEREGMTRDDLCKGRCAACNEDV